MQPVILESLQDGDPSIRKQAVKALVRTLDPKAPGILLRVASNDPDSSVRAYAQKAIDFLATKGITATDEDLFASDPVDVYTGTEKPKRDERAKGSRNNQGSWSNAGLDLVIYGLVNVGFVFFFTLLLAGNLTTTVMGLSTALNLSPMESEQLQLTLEAINAGAFLAGLGSGISTAVSAVIWVFIQVLLYHFAATMMLNGDGTIEDALSKVTTVNTIWLTLVGVVALGGVFFYFQGLPEDVALLQNESYMREYTVGYAWAFWFFPLSYLGLLVGTAFALADAYQFGWMSGCGVQILGVVMLACAYCAFAIVLGSAIG